MTWRAYMEERGPLSPFLRLEILTKLVHAAAGLKTRAGQQVKFSELYPWLQKESELTPEHFLAVLTGAKK